MTHVNRREILQHSAALGLGTVLLPATGRLHAAESQSTQVPAGIVLETVVSGGLSHYSYFLADPERGQAVVIDPRRDVQVYLDLASRYGVTITHAIETHIHADFVSGARELAAQSGTAKVAASAEGNASYGYRVDRLLKDGDRITAGRIVLQAIHTPGHTPEHLSFVAGSQGRGRPWALFTGDFLFVGSVGRPDLMGVENTDQLAKKLHDSVHSAFRELPGELTIYPAHGPGSPCGAGIQKPEGDPTLARERKGNPYWRMNDQQVFIEALLRAQPPIPYYWPRMKQINTAGPEVLNGSLQPQMMKPAQFDQFVASGNVQVLDTRSQFAFAGGHIRGSWNIGYNEVMSMWGGWILAPETPIALIKPAQGSVDDPVAWLSRVGLTNVAVALDGDLSPWVKSGRPFDSYETMSVHEVHRRLGDESYTLLDVRQPSEWDQGHLPGARYLFLPEILRRHQQLDKSKPVVVYCGNGYRASIGASVLRSLGYDARTVPGSWDAWKAAGYDTVRPAKPGLASDTTRVA